MKTPCRIDMSLFDDELKSLINAAAKIFPMSYADISSNLNPNNYEYARCLDEEHKNEIYIWNLDHFELIGADDLDIKFTDIKGLPTEYPPAPHTHSELHTHENKSIIDTITQVLLDAWNSAVNHVYDLTKHITSDERTLWNTISNKADKTYVDSEFEKKADIGHNHDGTYYKKPEVDSKLNNKSDIMHNHDTLYASKSIESTVSSQGSLITGLRTDTDKNTTNISQIQTNMANGDMHSNISVLNQLTQTLMDSWNRAVTHISDSIKHITSDERAAWNAKAEVSQIPTNNNQLTNGAGYQTASQVSTAISGKSDKTYVDTELGKKTDNTTFSGHSGNATVHVTQTDKDSWNGAAKITLGTIQPSIGWWFKQL